MLALLINHHWIEFAPRTRLRYTLDNPIFDSEGFARGFSYPFRIPATPGNLQALGYANRLDVRDKKRKYSGQLYAEGVLLETGIVQITGGGRDNIELVFKNTERDLVDEFANIRIRELLGTIQVPQLSAGVIRYFLQPASNWIIKIDENTFSYDDPGATQADAQLALIMQINAVYPGLAAPFSTDHIELLTNQYPNADYRVSEWINVTYVSGENVYEGRQTSLQTWINNMAATPRADISFPTFYNFYFHDREVMEEISQYLNYYQGGQNIDNEPTGTRSWNHSYVPFIRIRYLLEVAFQKLGYGIGGSLYDSEWIQQLIYYTGRAIDDLVEADFGPGLQYFNQYQQSINLPDFMPDITADELLRWIDFLNYYFEIVDDELHLRSRVTPLRQPPIDWSDRQEEEYNFDLPEEEGFRLEYARIEGELSLFDNQILDYGDGEKIYPFVLRPFYTSLFGSPLGPTWSMIATNKAGSSETIGWEHDADIRLALDRGLQEDRAGNTYVYASTNDRDSFDEVAYSSSLMLEGDNGVYQSHWAGFIELSDAPTLRRRLLLSIADILELKRWRNPMRYLYDPQGAVVAIIKRVSLQIDEQGLGLADIDFIITKRA